MLAAGFVDEVRRLRARGDLHAGLPSMRAVGYRQAWAALDDGDLATLARERDRGDAPARQAPADLAARRCRGARSSPATTPMRSPGSSRSRARLVEEGRVG